MKKVKLLSVISTFIIIGCLPGTLLGIDSRITNASYYVEGAIFTITYDLINDKPQPVVLVAYETEMEPKFNIPLDTADARGDLNRIVEPGVGKVITWDSYVAYGSREVGNFAFDIVIDKRLLKIVENIKDSEDSLDEAKDRSDDAMELCNDIVDTDLDVMSAANLTLHTENVKQCTKLIGMGTDSIISAEKRRDARKTEHTRYIGSHYVKMIRKPSNPSQMVKKVSSTNKAISNKHDDTISDGQVMFTDPGKKYEIMILENYMNEDCVNAGLIYKSDLRKADDIGNVFICFEVSVKNINGPQDKFINYTGFKLKDGNGGLYDSELTVNYISENIDKGDVVKGGLAFILSPSESAKYLMFNTGDMEPYTNKPVFAISDDVSMQLN